MYIELPEMTNKHQKVWDSIAPIVEVNKNLYRVYILSEISNPDDYGELVELLQDVDEDTTLVFFINTPGGVLDTALMLYNEIKKCKAKTIGKLSGTVASGGTMIALALDELEIAPFTAFMIHAWSVSGQAGKANEIEAQNAFMKKETKKMFSEIYKNFLTSREINKVINGTDIWLSKEDVEKRLSNR